MPLCFIQIRVFELGHLFWNSNFWPYFHGLFLKKWGHLGVLGIVLKTGAQTSLCTSQRYLSTRGTGSQNLCFLYPVYFAHLWNFESCCLFKGLDFTSSEIRFCRSYFFQFSFLSLSLESLLCVQHLRISPQIWSKLLSFPDFHFVITCFGPKSHFTFEARFWVLQFQIRISRTIELLCGFLFLFLAFSVSKIQLHLGARLLSHHIAWFRNLAQN